MSEKKHIDRLFQEKFKDFEAKPNANVWENIQGQLEQPVSKPKALPLWLRIAGIASLFALLFGIGNAFLGNNITDDKIKTVVETNTNESDTNTLNNNADDGNNTKNNSVENQVINKNNLVNTNISNKTHSNEATLSEKENNNANNVLGTSKENRNNTVTASVSNETLNRNSQNTVSNNSETNRNYKTNQEKAFQKNKNALSNLNTSQPQYTSSSQRNNVNNTTNVDNRSLNNAQNNNSIATNNQNNTANTTNNVTDVNNEVKTQNNVVDNKSIDNTNANTSTEALAQTNNEEEKTNMNPKNEDAQTPNPLDEALAKNEDSIEKEKEEALMNRWTVNANVAPVYYNTLGKGSHIHDQFIDNPKNGEVNTSYGINVGYALNDKLKVRSGINKLNLSYDTANVIVYENVSNTPNSVPLRNISFVPTNNGQSISVLSANNLSVQQVGGILSEDLNAALSQRIAYIEVPLELEYAIVNKRVGINIIGGMSTLILDGNEVVTEVENRKTKIGEANNINNVSFTTNIGLGIDYKFSDSFKFNIEPTFKYQMNAYNETSGDFKPYIIGVYTGFSYKF